MYCGGLWSQLKIKKHGKSCARNKVFHPVLQSVNQKILQVRRKQEKEKLEKFEVELCKLKKNLFKLQLKQDWKEHWKYLKRWKLQQATKKEVLPLDGPLNEQKEQFMASPLMNLKKEVKQEPLKEAVQRDNMVGTLKKLNEEYMESPLENIKMDVKQEPLEEASQRQDRVGTLKTQNEEFMESLYWNPKMEFKQERCEEDLHQEYMVGTMKRMDSSLGDLKLKGKQEPLEVAAEREDVGRTLKKQKNGYMETPAQKLWIEVTQELIKEANDCESQNMLETLRPEEMFLKKALESASKRIKEHQIRKAEINKLKQLAQRSVQQQKALLVQKARADMKTEAVVLIKANIFNMQINERIKVILGHNKVKTFLKQKLITGLINLKNRKLA